MYTVKKIIKIFNKAKFYYGIKAFTSLEAYMRRYNLSSDEWYNTMRETRSYMQNNKLNIFLFDEYFLQLYLQVLNKQRIIVDMENHVYH